MKQLVRTAISYRMVAAKRTILAGRVRVPRLDQYQGAWISLLSPPTIAGRWYALPAYVLARRTVFKFMNS